MPKPIDFIGFSYLFMINFLSTCGPIEVNTLIHSQCRVGYPIRAVSWRPSYIWNPCRCSCSWSNALSHKGSATWGNRWTCHNHWASCVAIRHTRNHLSTKTDVFLAGIASQLTVIVAHRMRCPEYIRSLKPLIAWKAFCYHNTIYIFRAFLCPKSGFICQPSLTARIWPCFCSSYLWTAAPFHHKTIHLTIPTYILPFFSF